MMAKKITVIGGSGFVGTNLCRQLSLKQQDFEIIDLKMSNQFPEKCKIADVRLARLPRIANKIQLNRTSVITNCIIGFELFSIASGTGGLRQTGIRWSSFQPSLLTHLAYSGCKS